MRAPWSERQECYRNVPQTLNVSGASLNFGPAAVGSQLETAPTSPGTSWACLGQSQSIPLIFDTGCLCSPCDKLGLKGLLQKFTR